MYENISDVDFFYQEAMYRYNEGFWWAWGNYKGKRPESEKELWLTQARHNNEQFVKYKDKWNQCYQEKKFLNSVVSK